MVNCNDKLWAAGDEHSARFEAIDDGQCISLDRSLPRSSFSCEAGSCENDLPMAPTTVGPFNGLTTT